MNGKGAALPAWIRPAFADFEEAMNSERGSVGELRRRALADLEVQGFPSPQNEDWKYTNIAGLLRSSFTPAGAAARPPSRAELESLAGPLEPHTAVFLNGRFCEELSTLQAQPAGVEVLPLGRALDEGAVDAWNALEQQARGGAPSFSLLNAAFLADGLLVRVRERRTVEAPLTVLFVTHAGEKPLAAFPRLIVAVESGSTCRLIEKHAGTGVYMSAPVTSITAGAGAIVDHIRLQHESLAAYHVSQVVVRAARAALVRNHALLFGASLTRNELEVVLEGEGANVDLNGLSVISGAQHADNHTVIDHAQPRCESREVYKGVYAGGAKGVFDGTIIVRPGAQKTNAVQSNRSLLLSRSASSNSKPQLKIWADDVRCTHGATVGQLDDDAIFYLQSRGISRNAARRVLTEAFAGEVLERIEPRGLREFALEIFRRRMEQAFAEQTASQLAAV